MSDGLLAGEDGLLPAVKGVCDRNREDLKSVTASHLKTDDRSLKINHSHNLTSTLFPKEMPALGQSMLLWKTIQITASN